MVNFMKKIPAGMLLVPMVVSALINTINPEFFHIGGITEALLGADSMPFLIGLISFFSGVAIETSNLRILLKRHGVLALSKIIWVIIVSLIYMSLFGQDGILGISAVALTVALSGINPSLYVSIVNNYGNKIDEAAYGIFGIFSAPFLPVLVYSIQGTGNIDWMPVISTLLPLILGILLGMMDSNFRKVFHNGVGLLIPVIGWKIGQGMNLLQVLDSGISGIILTILFYILLIPLITIDRNVLKNDGIVGIGMNATPGTAASFPLIIGLSNPEIMPYMRGAAAQLVTVTIITAFLTPILSKQLYLRNNANK